MLGVFTDQAYNLILLAEDEARMLGRSVVEPEHLLLALARRGNVESLLSERGVAASDIHGVIVRGGRRGDDLVLGRVPRSAASDAVLERAVELAARRGVLGPSSEHVLLGLAEDAGAMRVLREVGVPNVVQLVDARYPTDRGPVSSKEVTSYLLRVGESSPPDPGPGPPVFERFTAEAQRAVRAAVESAALLEHHQVEPFHLLLGCLHVSGSLACRVLARELAPSDMGTLGEAMERARMYGPDPAHQATGIFSDTTRQIVAEEAPKQAYRHDHDHIGTGHLLLATLDSRDRTTSSIIGTGVMGSGPVSGRIARQVTRELPGDEHTIVSVNDRPIQLDVLIRMLTVEFAKIVPAGWTVTGSGRGGGIGLEVPDSRSEDDFRIDLDWIVAHDGPAQQRLLQVIRSALESLQKAITTHTGQPWPTDHASGQGNLPEAHVEIAGDDVNPVLRMWYGERTEPTVALFAGHDPLVNMIVNSF